MDNRFYNSSRSVLTGALKTTRQLNKRQKDILGFIYSQATCMHASVYRENGCIAISSVSLGQACRPAVSDKIALSIAYELEKAGLIKIKRSDKGEKGVANRYTLTDLFFEMMEVTNNEVKNGENMDQDNELQRQIQSLQAENAELRLQLEEKDKHIAELQARLDKAIKWYNANKNVFGMVKTLQAENAELKKASPNVSDEDLKRENEKLRRDKDEAVRKEKAAVRESFNERQKNSMQKEEINRLKRYEKVFNSLLYQGVIDQNGNPVGDGMVTVEPGEPYKVMKVDEFMQELSIIKNKN